jgi:hypothetical protein
MKMKNIHVNMQHASTGLATHTSTASEERKERKNWEEEGVTNTIERIF